MAGEATYSLEDAMAELQTQATAEGRCPHCGRRHEDQEGKLFASLREELATARQERDEAQKDLQAAQDSNAMYAAEVESLKKRLVEATE